MVDLAPNLPSTFKANYFHFGNTSPAVELARLENTGNVLGD